MKPKENKKGNKNKSANYDRCQTPIYALDPLLPYLNKNWLIWESACGNGNLVKGLIRNGYDTVIATDLLQGINYFDWQPQKWDISITNCPYSIKYKWLQRSYELNKPFALLLPLETLGAATAQKLFSKHGIEIILLNKRVNFNMPNIGYNGTAQFPTAWFTWGLNIGQQLTYGKVNYYADEQGKLL